MKPEPLPPPSNSPKSGVTKLPVETIWMVAEGRSSTVVTKPSGTASVVVVGFGRGGPAAAVVVVDVSAVRRRPPMQVRSGRT